MNQFTDRTTIHEESTAYKEAFFYASMGDEVRCGLCPHNCLLSEGHIGLCRTRKNIRGKLYTLAYGNPCAINIDPIEKKPLYHFLPGSEAFSIATAGCNFTCLNCQNYHISQKSPVDIITTNVSPETIIKKCQDANCKAIAYTYTEPTVFYEYMYDIAQLAHEEGIRNVMISNGYINPGPLKKLIPLLDAVNIDLKAMDEEVYKNLNGGSLKPVLHTLKILKDMGVWIEITNLLVPGYSTHPDLMQQMCKWLVINGFSEYPLHFSRFFPTYRLKHLSSTPIATLKLARDIALQTGLKYVYLGNISESEHSNTYCPKCKKLLIERMGYLVRQMHIIDGKCPNCAHPIAGVWN